MKKYEDPCDYSGKTLGTIVADRISEVTRTMQELQQQRKSMAFLTLGDLVQEWMLGKIRFVSTEKVEVTGDPAKTLERCREAGMGLEDLGLEGKSLDEVLGTCHETIADLTYLLIRGAIRPEQVCYQPPGYKGIDSLIDVNELRRRFPEVDRIAAIGEPFPAAIAIVAIAVVDVVVLVLDYVRVRD